jgi:hypothetical protein
LIGFGGVGFLCHLFDLPRTPAFVPKGPVLDL